MSKPRRRGGLSSSVASSNTAGGGGGSNSAVTNSYPIIVGSDSSNHLHTANTGTTSSSMTLVASSSSASIAATNTSPFLVGGSTSSNTAAVGRAPRSKVSSNVKQAEQDDVDHYEEMSVTNTATNTVTTAKGGRKKKRAKRGGSNKEDRFAVEDPPLLSTATAATSNSAVGRTKGGTTASTSYENTSPTPATGSRAIHRKVTSNKTSNITGAAAATKRVSSSGVAANSANAAKDDHRVTSTSHSTNDIRSISSSISPICVDPGSLTRGMTARKIGHCVASMVRGLNSQQVQADLELMDAYTEACRVYSQKYFAYRNPDLCRIVDEKSATVEYVGIQQLYSSTATSTTGTSSSDGTSLPMVAKITNPDKAHIEQTSSPSSTQPNIVSSPQLQQVQQQRARWLYGAQQVMPTRIDPEEEKRIAALRQMISTHEKQREDLEAQYTSLRANYIRELQLLQASKHENTVSLQLLQKLCYKRAKALALKRIRCQFFTDVLACLLFRRVTIEEFENSLQTRSMEQKDISVESITPPSPPTDSNSNDDDNKTTSDKNVEDGAFVTAAPHHANTTSTNSMDKDVVLEDVVDEKEEVKVQLVPKLNSKDTIEELYEILDLIESELNEAELDCTNVDVPDDMLGNAVLAQLIRNPPMNTGNSKAAVVVEKDTEKSTSSIPPNGGTSKDVTKSCMDVDTTNTTKLEKRKYRRRAMSCGSVDDTGGNESSAKKNNTNPSKEDDVLASSKVTPVVSTSVPSLSLPLSIKTNELAIPWRSLTIPRTPRGVPLYISQLSSYPDKVAGASYGGFLGNKSTDMRYLLPLDRIHGCDHSAYGLPGSLHSKEIEIKEMEQLDLEISHLEASIQEERQRNDKLQSLAIDRKRKSDEICTAMILLRSETENLLLRHNIILNSKEARLRSWEVVKEGRKDDASSTHPSQVSDIHEEEEMMEEDDEEEDFDVQAELESCEAGAEEEDDDEEEEGQAPEEEDDLDESELENTGYENEMDKDDVVNTDVDDEVENDEEENLVSSVDGEGEDEEEEEDEEEDDVSPPTANRSRRIVIRTKANRPEASESEEDLEEEEDTDVDTGGYDDQGSGNEGEMNPSGDEDYSDEDEVDCNDDGVHSIGGEEPKSGSTSSENSGDNSNNEENTADEDSGSEIDGEEMGEEEYEPSEQFDSNIKEI